MKHARLLLERAAQSGEVRVVDISATGSMVVIGSDLSGMTDAGDPIRYAGVVEHVLSQPQSEEAPSGLNRLSPFGV